MKPEKKEKLAQFHRENIVETAEKLFAQKGIAQTTMDDIAKTADYSKSTIYVYFRSKEEIYYYIIYEHMCSLKELAGEALMDTEFVSCYQRLCDGLVTFYEQYPLYFASIMGKISTTEKDLAEQDILRQIYDVGEEINDRILSLFQKGIKEKVLREDLSILPAAFTLWASIGNLIPFAYEKEAYISKRMQMSRDEFLQYGFGTLLDAVRRR